MGNNKVIFGQEYSAIYDSVHGEKNYLAEAIQIANIITKTVGPDSKILDFGCGTGKHVSGLSDLGFVISGYDLNSNMIDMANINFPALEFFSDLSSVPKSFNFIYSLFDVLSYQVTDFEVSGFLQQINSKFADGGWVLLDGWHLPGLRQDPPSKRLRFFEFNGERFRREVVVLEKTQDHLTSLRIQIVKDSDESVLTREVHQMRAFNSDEIVDFIHAMGGSDIQFFNGGDYTKSLHSNDWKFGVLFRI